MVSPLDAKAKELLDGMEGVTPGPWQVVIDSHPWKLAPNNGGKARRGKHTERRIFTVDNDAQLKAPWPVVNLSTGITEVPGKAVEFVHIEDADAAHIARCSPDVLRPILEAFTAQAERIAELERENAELRTQDDPRYVHAFVLRAAAAEAEVRTLREALTAGVRAANLALFVIRKQGVMPNSSWQAGFEKDMAIASAALRAKEP